MEGGAEAEEMEMGKVQLVGGGCGINFLVSSRVKFFLKVTGLWRASGGVIEGSWG